MNDDEIKALRAAMRSAQPTGKGVYIEAGKHVLKIKKCFRQATPIEGRIKESWICEFEVEASTNETHEVGSTRSYVENPENAGWMGRWKAFLIAAAGIPSAHKMSTEDEDTIADMQAALRDDEFRKAKKFPENFMAGQRVICEGMPGKSRSGTTITNKRWEPAT